MITLIPQNMVGYDLVFEYLQRNEIIMKLLLTSLQICIHHIKISNLLSFLKKISY